MTYKEPGIAYIKIGRCVGHVERMQANGASKKIRQILVGRSNGRPKLKYMDQVEQDLITLKDNNWKEARSDQNGRKY